MPMMLYLVPRATTEWSATGRWAGEVDLPPTAAGLAQAQAWAGTIATYSRADALAAPPARSGVWQGLVQALSGEPEPVAPPPAEAPIPVTDVLAQPQDGPSPALAGVYSSSGATSHATGEALAAALGVPHDVDDALAEVSLGLWQGLTTAQLAHRHGKAFRAWQEDPAAITPPEGESLADAAARLTRLLTRHRRKFAHRQVAWVLGPLALALVRQVAGDLPWDRFWGLVNEPPAVHRIGGPARRRTAKA